MVHPWVYPWVYPGYTHGYTHGYTQGYTHGYTILWVYPWFLGRPEADLLEAFGRLIGGVWVEPPQEKSKKRMAELS